MILPSAHYPIHASRAVQFERQLNEIAGSPLSQLRKKRVCNENTNGNDPINPIKLLLDQFEHKNWDNYYHESNESSPRAFVSTDIRGGIEWQRLCRGCVWCAPIKIMPICICTQLREELNGITFERSRIESHERNNNKFEMIESILSHCFHCV